MATKFNKPKDIKAWWCAPHCGPGTTDVKEDCGFCGDNVLDCAVALTNHLRDSKGEGTVVGDGRETDGGCCGGSGFWCHGCGRFWAQNVCGDSGGPDHQAADGAKLVPKDRHVYCVCGTKLFADGLDYQDQHPELKVYFDKLREMGFTLEDGVHECFGGEKKIRGGKLEVQLWTHGPHRVTHWQGGSTKTTPTEFKSIPQMLKAIARHESQIQ